MTTVEIFINRNLQALVTTKISNCKKVTKDAKILKYPNSMMLAAIAAVKEKRFKIREAARHFGVPHSTLINKLKGRVPLERKMGRSTYLTTSEEDLLVKYIKANAKKGIPIKRRTLQETVKKILDDDKRLTPFKNNTPGKKWIALFYARHPDITEKKAKGISTSRAQVSTEDLKQWHQSLKEHLIEENALDIIDDPKRIFNADESGFQTCPQSGNVIGPANMKNFYEIKSGKEKEQLTVMLGVNAAGQIVSPMIVYPLVRISRDIAVNVPESWSIGKSPTGWMNGPLYYEYIANIFDPWLKANNIQKPVLLLVDGHRSHLTLQVSQYCAENQIIAYALFPNSTHITQPADVSVFKCLKSGWKNTVSEYKQNSGNRQITRAGFAPLLAKVFQEKVTATIVANGFKRCGLYPFNVNGIDFSKCIDHESRKTAPVSAPTSTNCVTPAPVLGVETLLLFESYMRRGRVQEFRRSSEQWEGEESAKELFYTWKKFRQCCLSGSLAVSAEKGNDADSTESQRAMTQSPSVLRVQTADIHSSQQSLQSTTPSQKQNTAGTPDEPLTATTPLSSELPNLVKEAEVITRFNTPVQELPDLSDNAELTTKFNTPAPNAPNFMELSESLKEVDTPILKAPDLPEGSKTPIRCNTPVSQIMAQIPDHPKGSETPTSSTSPVSNVETFLKKAQTKTPEKNLKVCTTKAVTLSPKSPGPSSPGLSSGFQGISSPLTNMSLIVQKQKQVSPAFGNHLIWPSDSPIKKTKKERLPFATSSKKWQEYWILKDQEKKQKSAQVEAKKRIREEKKALTAKTASKRVKKIKKKIVEISDSSESDEEMREQQITISDGETDFENRAEDSEEDYFHKAQGNDHRLSVVSEGYKQNDFVIFDYDGTYFVGQIVSTCEDGVLIKSMHKSLKNWKWPEKDDFILYRIEDIKEKIQEPRKINEKRGIYSVPEFEKYTDFV